MERFTGEFLYELELFMERMAAFLQQAKAAPELMWRQTASSPGNRVMLIIFALGFAGGAIYLLVCFLRVSFREKLKMLFVGLIVLLVLLIIFWFALM